jgi:hypothetical protein
MKLVDREPDVNMQYLFLYSLLLHVDSSQRCEENFLLRKQSRENSQRGAPHALIR